jgi:hypothetical protein
LILERLICFHFFFGSGRSRLICKSATIDYIDCMHGRGENPRRKHMKRKKSTIGRSKSNPSTNCA